MTPLRRAGLLTAFFCLVTAGIFLRSDGRESTTTSFGDTPNGYRAAYELLRRLPVPVSRSFSDPAALAKGTLWLVDPPALCGPGERLATAGDYDADSSLAQWVRRGGNLVVFLDAGSTASCDAVGGLELPAFEPPFCEDGVEDGSESDLAEVAKKPATIRMNGPLVPSARRLEAGLHTFVPDSSWEAVLDGDGHPFVVEQALGDGRVVVVADAGVMSNRSLDRFDSALFVVDLVHQYGDPWIDEWMHGFRSHESLPLFLLGSPALPVFCGVALLAMALAWYGAVVPPRTPQSRLLPPSLESSIDALAAAYAATADYPALHERYRHYAIGRLRHSLGLTSDTPLEVVADSLERRRRIPRERVRALFERASAADRGDMLQQIHRLDQLIQEARQ